MRGEGKLLVGPREALLCYRLSSITRASTESSTHQVIFTPHSEKQNHGSVKAALLCFFLFQMKIKAFQCLLICLTSLLTYSGCSQAFWYGGSPYLNKVPGFLGELHLCKYNQQQRSKARMVCVPGPPAFPWLSPLLQYKPQGAELPMFSSGGTPGSCPPAAGIAGPRLLTGVVALQSCLLLPPCPAATAAQLPPLLFVNH